jgi:multiple sugar transport system ATP-binding protein
VLYEQPTNLFVAGFIGSPSMSFCTVPMGANGSVSLGGTQVPVGAAANGRREVVIGLRPESLELSSEGLPAEVEVVEEFGADAYVFCVAEVGGTDTKLVARVEARRAPERGERVTLRPKPDEAHVFDPETGARL